MPPGKSDLPIIIIALIYGVSLWYLGYGPDQSDFYHIIVSYTLAFLCYLGLLQFASGDSAYPLHWFLLIAIVARGPLIFSWPNLSDDIYRFLWDGHLLLQGMSPFHDTPRQLMIELSGSNNQGPFPELFPLLNSQDYFTVYPPVNQLLFSLGAAVSGTSWLAGSAVMKAVIVGVEWLGIKAMIQLLDHYGLSRRNVLLYALNPLIIIEGIGNLHIEPMMIALFFLSMRQMVQGNLFKSSLLYTLSILTKLQTLLFLPLFIRRMGNKVWMFFGLIAGLIILAFTSLLDIQLLGHMAESLELYFRRFEFNASMYYIFRWFGYTWKGFNLIGVIGPGLALLSILGILFLYLREKEHSFGPTFYQTALFAFCLYLFLGTTVHPWYICFPVALCVFTRFRFPILWSMLIPLTYINYSYPEYGENLILVAIEYVLVYGLLIKEVLSANRAVST